MRERERERERDLIEQARERESLGWLRAAGQRQIPLQAVRKSSASPSGGRRDTRHTMAMDWN